MNNLKRLVFIKEIVSVMKTLPKLKTPVTGVHEWILPKNEGKTRPVLSNLSRKMETEGELPNRVRPASPNSHSRHRHHGKGKLETSVCHEQKCRTLTTSQQIQANGV